MMEWFIREIGTDKSLMVWDISWILLEICIMGILFWERETCMEEF